MCEWGQWRSECAGGNGGRWGYLSYVGGNWRWLWFPDHGSGVGARRVYEVVGRLLEVSALLVQSCSRAVRAISRWHGPVMRKATGSPIRNCIARPTSHICHDWRAYAFAFTAFVVPSYGNLNITNDEEV